MRSTSILIASAAAFLSLRVSAMTAALSESVALPAPVGTMITWTGSSPDAATGTLWYRFSIQEAGGPLRVIKDYGPDNTLNWMASAHEGSYQLMLDIRNLSTGETAATLNSFEIQTLVTSGQPVVTPTSHPLVFLYSAPPCQSGAHMRVEFSGPERVARYTPLKACTPGVSMNFYLAGLQQQTQYSAVYAIDTGSGIERGPVVTFATGQLPSGLAAQSVVKALPARNDGGILLESTLFTDPLAVDLNGNLIWYYQGNITFITRPEAGGYFFAELEDQNADQSGQLLLEFDLTGTTVLETNAARINEQLTALGKRNISAFHHEARRLANGNILVLASVEQILTNVQGPGPVDVLGDMIIVLDQNLQVLWTWDTFDHLDPARMATLNDQCLPGDCPPLFLASIANDWTHGNSVQETPDGDLLYSARAQDWVIKIDYKDGLGSGAILWKLGPDGDFQINSSDPSPWFTHQHDPQFLADNTTLVLLDNGNVRYTADPNAHSRGQVLELDQINLTANLVVNMDLGQFSFALGSAQSLGYGEYHFDVGFLYDGTSFAVELNKSGKLMFNLHVAAPEYRSFRMPDLYTPLPPG